jgi:hypothetical protein
MNIKNIRNGRLKLLEKHNANFDSFYEENKLYEPFNSLSAVEAKKKLNVTWLEIAKLTNDAFSAELARNGSINFVIRKNNHNIYVTQFIDSKEDNLFVCIFKPGILFKTFSLKLKDLIVLKEYTKKKIKNNNLKD